MTSDRLPGILILVGSLLFFLAAFMPISWVFAEHDAAKKLEMINSSRSAWVLAQIFFGSGAVITAMGLFLLYLNLRNKSASTASLIFFLFAFIGAIFWVWHVYLRATNPDGFAYRLLHPNWLAGAYFALTQIAILSLGIAFLQAQYPQWLGWLNIGAFILFTIFLIVAHDIPPFFYYIIFVITAMYLIIKRH